MIGSIFKYEAENITRTEIVFFVTVHIVDSGADSREVSQSDKIYEKYVAQKGRDEFGDKLRKGEKPYLPFARKGMLNVSEKREVLGEVASPVTTKKEKRPLLDFRK